ncbi:terminase large subunit domain-containing protein [Erwinia persicina]|uniref:terminase large subunit domain-containing protein n=1 Tax=Erwinia persicina TaxID=55211 RepID=UPI001786D3C7|nr:terminase family protein [Erwinia persicina]MBD8169539.1 oxidoreductase [Erwinia persicina]
MKTVTDPRDEAKSLYWQAYSIPQIAQRLGLSANTIYSWRRRDAWDATTPIQRALERTDVRYLRLMAKEDLSAHDFKTLDVLGRQLARLARDERKEKDQEKKEKTPKNHFSAEQIAELRALVLESLFEHQKRWYKQRNRRNRFILKSRQIGASWYFAREALLRALETGTNQIFLSASRAQAFQFKKFIIFLARSIGIELKGGDEIILSNGATLYFLGTSAATAQSYTGDLYFDEAFWVANFLNLRKVAAGMATHVGLRRTYFSTPSSEEHEAYEFWTGNLFNKGRGKKERADLDLSHKALKDGQLCADNIWRQIVTVQDVIDQGFPLIDLEEIQNENSPDEFDNLYRCIFVKQGERAFNYNELINCGVDGYSGIWPDWNPYAPRPLGNRKVWIGYDPNGGSGKGDSGGLVVLAPPLVPGGKFRVVERHQLRGMEFEEQAAFIKRLTTIYDVQHIDIDGTGIGAAVYELVLKFFPAAQLHLYTPAVKRQLVLKAQMVIRAGRFEYDAGMMDIVSSFMTIRKLLTPKGGTITYASDRKRGSNHGDLAWATMHALQNEPLGNDAGSGNDSFVEEF